MRVHPIALVLCATAFIAGSGLPALSNRLAAAPQPPKSPPAESPPAPASGQRTAVQPVTPDNYIYEGRGRRDPFVNLLATPGEPRLGSKRGEGAAGWSVAEISVRGIVQSRGVLVAMVRGPDNRTLLVHPGDRFLDGTVKTITPQGLIIVQEVNDPLSLVKQREIRKQLRTLEDTKP